MRCAIFTPAISKTSDAKRFGQHANAFGFLRLFFASAVIISHVPEIAYGSRKKEIFTALFGSISLGDVAVDAFFLISGYLITASYLGSKSPGDYLKKRILRIYPGFLCAYFLCVLIVAPIGGASFPVSFGDLISVVTRALLLQSPSTGNVFVGSFFPFLNTSMWTISVEFKCYLLAFVLGLSGLLDKRKAIIVFASLLLMSTVFVDIDTQPFDGTFIDRPIPNIFTVSEWNEMLLGTKRRWLRLTGIFLTGSCFYLYRDIIVLRFRYCVVAACILLICLCFSQLAHLGVALFGGYLVFSVAEMSGGGFLSHVNNKSDISYGVYLYAWPVTKLLFWYFPAISVLSCTLLTIAISWILGWVSWITIEKPVLSLMKPAKARSGSSPGMPI